MKKVFIILILIIIGGGALYFFFLGNKTINNKMELMELLGIDFVDIEITDIQYQNGKTNDIPYTNIAVFYNDTTEALLSREYYHSSTGAGLSDPNLEYISPGDIQDMEAMGIDIDSIRNHGCNYKDFNVGWQQRPYAIHWYELDEGYGYNGNVLILTSIDATIKLNVEKIMKD